MRPGQVIILHEWDGQAYFQALDLVVRRETGAPPVYREVWFIRQLALGLLRRKPALVRRALRNAAFFARSFFLRDRIVLLGIAPFDFSLWFWSRLRRRNKVIYHTSWLKWDGSEVVHSRHLFPGTIRRRWRDFLEDPRVKVVSVLPESGEDLRRHYRKAESEVTAIPHAVDLTVFRAAARRAAGTAPAGAAERPLRVIYLGRLNSIKGIDVLADLIARADPARFAFGVAGEGPEWDRLEPLRDRFRYHGYVASKAAVAAVLAEYDVLVIPSVFELFGLAFIEAMACGVVCVASNGLFTKDLVVHGVNGFVVERTAEAFLGALEALRADPVLREAFRARGFERVKDFELDAIGERWKRVLEAP